MTQIAISQLVWDNTSVIWMVQIRHGYLSDHCIFNIFVKRTFKHFVQNVDACNCSEKILTFFNLWSKVSLINLIKFIWFIWLSRKFFNKHLIHIFNFLAKLKWLGSLKLHKTLMGDFSLLLFFKSCLKWSLII